MKLKNTRRHEVRPVKAQPATAEGGVKLWIAGKLTSDWRPDGCAWEFQGVFDSKAKADKACRTRSYFYFSVALNQELPDRTIHAADSCYPRDCAISDGLSGRGRKSKACRATFMKEVE